MKLSSIFLLTTSLAALASPAAAGQCRDPWVTQAIQQSTGHAPRGAYESMDCNYKLYGGGQWSSYADLLNKVRASYRDPASPGIAGSAAASMARQQPGFAPGVNAGGIIGNDAGSMRDRAGNLIGQDGNSMRR